MKRLATLIPADPSGTPKGDTNEALLWNPTFNLLRDDPQTLPGLHTSGFVLRCWSGWTSDDPTDPDPARWSPQAFNNLHAACANFFHHYPSAQLVLRNHHRHVLHDHHTLLRFAQRWEQAPHGNLSFLIDPASWLTAQMIPDYEDHLARTAEGLEGTPMWRELMLTNLAPDAEQDPLSTEKLGIDIGPPMRQSPLHRGLLDARRMVKILSAPIGRADTVVLSPGDRSAQTEFLPPVP